MAREARVETPATFLPVDQARPFRVDIPILKPVNEPGPISAAKMSIAATGHRALSRWDFIEPRSQFECVPASPTVHSEMSLLSSIRAMEPDEEEVSIDRTFNSYPKILKRSL